MISILISIISYHHLLSIIDIDLKKDWRDKNKKSFDVESLLTNKSLEKTIEIVLSKLFKDKNNREEGLNRFQFESLLRTVTQQSNFTLKATILTI